MALGKLLEGAAWFATLSLATVGTLTFLPDGAWESLPTALRPARAKLAEFGVAPTCYRVENGENGASTATGAESGAESSTELAANGGLAKGTAGAAWGSATKVRIGERWKSVQKVGETAFLDNGRGNLGGAERTGAVLETALSANLGENLGENLGAAEATSPAALERLDAAFSGVDGSSDKRGVSAAGERNVALELNDAQPLANEGGAVPDVAADVADWPVAGLADENLGGVDEAWDANSIPLFDDGTGATSAQGEATGATSAQGETIGATSATQAQGNVDGGAGFEGFNGLGASTPLLAEADAALPSGSEGDGASGVGSLGVETVDLQSALAAASTASTPEEIKTVFETLNQIRDAQGARLSAEEARALDAALDRLAFDVFYNPAKAILEPRWQTAPGESLASIAERLGTTPETLAEINGIKAQLDAPLPIGTTLKTVRGPASAEISIAKKELTLRFNGLYAGRFALGVPESSANLRGDFRVVEKLANPNCDAVDANGQTIAIPGGAPENPLGSAWIALDGGVGLQGTNRPELVGQTIPENGGFVFSNREISQLSVLLPVGAVVRIVD